MTDDASEYEADGAGSRAEASGADAPTLSVLVITAADYGYNARAVEPLLEADAVDVLGVTTIPPTLGTEGQLSFLRRVIAAFGPRLFVRQLFARLRYAVLDRVNGLLGRGPRYAPQSLAREHDVEHVSTESVNDESYLEYVRELDPDVVVAAGATERFEPELLSIPDRGCINVHDSLLPEYRGVMPSFWVLRHGEERTGVTVHRMVPELDAGDVLLQREVEVRPDDSYHTLRLRTASASGDALAEALEDLARDSLDPEPLDVDEGSYYSFPTREDLEAFRRAGRSYY